LPLQKKFSCVPRACSQPEIQTAADANYKSTVPAPPQTHL
jgi:hypothetical protein